MPSRPEPDIIIKPGLLALLQMSDSFFPTGAFAHSLGLETYVQEDLVTSRESLTEFMVSYLLGSVAGSDGLATRLSYRSADQPDWEAIAEIDRILTAQKMPRETREASIKTGRRLLSAAKLCFPGSLLETLSDLIARGTISGHHAVVFGVIARSIDIGEHNAALSFVYTAAAAMVNNAVRLIPLGQNDGQLALSSLRKTMQETVEISSEMTLDDLGSSTPALEIRAMQHERLYSRLFMS